MAATKPGKKEQTHARIVEAAAKSLRRNGYDGVGVAEVMRDAGLTHGGFYAHFASRETMLAEALAHASETALASLQEKAAARASTTGEDLLTATVANYLSDRHVSSSDAGCTLASLGSETRRQNPDIRRVATRQVKDFVAMLAKQMDERGDANVPEPLAALSCLVGALVIARVVDEPVMSRAVREAAARLVLGPQAPKPLPR